jgi:integrase
MKRERGTGSLRLRGATWWARYHHHGKLVEESTKTSDEVQARKFLKAKVKASNTPLFVDPSARRITFDDLVELVRRESTRKGNRTGWRLGTAEHPRQCVRYLTETFGGTPALHITADDVDRYADARIAAGAQPATVNRELAILRHGFKLGVRKGLLPSMPHVAMRSEAGNERQGFLDPVAFDAFLDALRQRDPVVADLTQGAYFTLLRRSNISKLTWPQLSLDVQDGEVVGGELRLPGTMTKNKRPLALPLTGRLLALINHRWQVRSGEYVFHRDGVRLKAFTGVWKPAARVIGQPGLLFHDLRRSGARALIRAGVPEDVVLKLGGWLTRSMLTRYNVVDTSDLADAQAKLTAAFAPAPKVKALRRAS